MRKMLFASPCLALAAVVACSAAPDGGEVTQSTASALDPNQVFNPTYYTVTITKIQVNRAVEPYQAGDMVNYSEPLSGAAGIPAGEPANASITRTPGDGQACGGGYDSMVWSPDSGFVYAAQLGVKVTPTIPGPAPWNTGNPYPTACTFGGGSTGTVFQGSYCKSNAFGAGFTNDQLTVGFYVNPGDQLALAFTLDNAETANIASVSSSLNNSVSTDVKDFGDAAKLAGAVISTAGGTAVGGAVALVGAAATVAGDLVSVSGSQGCSATQLSVLATSCQGGLAGPPPGGSCSSGWPGASTTLEGCSFAATPPDLLRIVDPSVTDGGGNPVDLTAERLQALTATGPLVLEFEPRYDFTNPSTSGTTTWYHVPRGTTGAGIMAGCASDVTIDVTIARDWYQGAGGPAAFAKSGDMSVVRSPNTIDTFAAVPSSYENQLVHDWGTGTSFSSEIEAPATSLEESGVSMTTVPAVVSRTESNLDMFYSDGNGGVYTVFQAAPSYTWYDEQLAAPTSCPILRPLPVTLDAHPDGITPLCKYSIAPANAYVTAAARTPDNLDVFFIGRDGNVYTTYWSSSMGTSSSGLPNWGAPYPLTEQGCTMTNIACAGSASPGGGIAAISRSPTELDVFWVGQDGGIWTAYWNEGSEWTTMEIAGPNSQWQQSAAIAPAGAVISATARTAINIDVFTVGYDAGVWVSSWSGTNNHWGTTEVPGSYGSGIAGGPISAVARQAGALDAVYQSSGTTLNWAHWAAPATTWSFAPIPVTEYGMATSMLGRGAVSIVAPTSYSLQAFYMNGFHQENTVTWSDTSECNTVSGTPCTPSNSAWTGEMTLPQP